jgi:hypothetical protein
MGRPARGREPSRGSRARGLHRVARSALSRARAHRVGGPHLDLSLPGGGRLHARRAHARRRRGRGVRQGRRGSWGSAIREGRSSTVSRRPAIPRRCRFRARRCRTARSTSPSAASRPRSCAKRGRRVSPSSAALRLRRTIRTAPTRVPRTRPRSIRPRPSRISPPRSRPRSWTSSSSAPCSPPEQQPRASIVVLGGRRLQFAAARRDAGGLRGARSRARDPRAEVLHGQRRDDRRRRDGFTSSAASARISSSPPSPRLEARGARTARTRTRHKYIAV